MPSILQEWVTTLGLRHQGLLVSAVRGCDIAHRDDPSKHLQRIYRGAILIPHIGHHESAKTYIQVERDYIKWTEHAENFLRCRDPYPNHYIMHFLHAAEIIGYHGPWDFPVFGDRWREFYFAMCQALHLPPESKTELDSRLNADEEAFFKQQR